MVEEGVLGRVKVRGSRRSRSPITASEEGISKLRSQSGRSDERTRGVQSGLRLVERYWILSCPVSVEIRGQGQLSALTAEAVATHKSRSRVLKYLSAISSARDFGEKRSMN